MLNKLIKKQTFFKLTLKMTHEFCLIFFMLLLLIGCAEVGTISGGIKDEFAPKIIKSTIQNGSINFNDQLIEFTFDEFVQLNKPTENIFLVPNHPVLEAKLLKKTLQIRLSKALEKNTTYTLYLNAAVKDVTEGNDSLMQFTFSTGSKLDSLKFSVRTTDAFSSLVKSKITVGLFDSLNAVKPIYFGQTNQNGLITLTAIKEGTYYCKAFDDKNKDIQIQKDEDQDWNFEPILINRNSLDTLKLKLSKPNQKDRIKNAKFLPPGLIGLHIPSSLEINKILINGDLCSPKHFFQPKQDSLQIAIGDRAENEFELIIDSDTFNVRRLEKNKMVPLKPRNISDENGISNTSQYEVMDIIQSVDIDKIEVLKLPDSIKVNFLVDFDKNKLKIEPTEKSLKKYHVLFNEGAIRGISGKTNNSTKIEIPFKEDRELGSLNLKLSQPMEFGILQLLCEQKVIEEQKTSLSNKSILFDRLIPGDYTFRIIEDLNQNGQWDAISIENQLKAEEVFHFNTPIKVRANWEVETILELK
jgi:uncharacterized protein (DUF2141 family)